MDKQPELYSTIHSSVVKPTGRWYISKGPYSGYDLCIEIRYGLLNLSKSWVDSIYLKEVQNCHG